jgi:hypothetical protein
MTQHAIVNLLHELSDILIRSPQNGNSFERAPTMVNNIQPGQRSAKRSHFRVRLRLVQHGFSRVRTIAHSMPKLHSKAGPIH